MSRKKRRGMLGLYELHFKILAKLIDESGRRQVFLSELARELDENKQLVWAHLNVLEKMGLVKGRGAVGPQGGHPKYFSITDLGVKFLLPLREAIMMLEKPALPADAHACLEALKSKNKQSRRLGAENLRKLCQFKRLTPEAATEVIKFLNKSLLDASYAPVRKTLLWAWTNLLGQFAGWSFREEERAVLHTVYLDGLRQYCLKPDDKSCASIALGIITQVNNDLALDVLIDMVRILEDEKYDADYLSIECSAIGRGKVIKALKILRDESQEARTVRRASELLERLGAWFELPPELKPKKSDNS